MYTCIYPYQTGDDGVVVLQNKVLAKEVSEEERPNLQLTRKSLTLMEFFYVV